MMKRMLSGFLIVALLVTGLPAALSEEIVQIVQLDETIPFEELEWTEELWDSEEEIHETELELPEPTDVPVTLEALPELMPEITAAPIVEATIGADVVPTVEPSIEPTAEPTVDAAEGTAEPTIDPAVGPTADPAAEPTPEATLLPEESECPEATVQLPELLIGSGEYSYTITTDEEGQGFATITKYLGSSAHVVIPEKIEDCTVIAIGAKAFEKNFELVSVSFPDSVHSIGYSAFNTCRKLESVEINTAEIGDFAFANCSGLVSVKIGADVRSIGKSAFYCCSSLTDVSFEEGVETLGEGVFCQCLKLESLLLPDSITTLGKDIIKTTAVHTLRLPAGIGVVPNGVFWGNSSLQTVIFAEGITSIGDDTSSHGAFSSCKNLTTVVFPESLERITARSFEQCDKLDNLVLNAAAVDYHAFGSCDGLTNVKIGSGVKRLGGSAFGGCKNLVSVEFEDGLETLADNVFQACPSLKTLSLPDSVTSIGQGIISNSGVETLKLSAGLSAIPGRAFYGIKTLKNVIIPEGVTAIGSASNSTGAFQECSALASVSFPQSLETIGKDAFKGCGLQRLEVSADTIEESAFESCVSLKEAKVQARVIVRRAFKNCVELETVKLEAETIKEWAFENCDRLVYVDTGSNLTTLVKEAFRGSGALESLILRANVVSIGSNAIPKNENLAVYVEADSFAEQYAIENGYNCQYIFAGEKTVTINLPEEASAFSGCRLVLVQNGENLRRIVRLGSADSSYSFAALEENGSYTISLLDPYGHLIAPEYTFTVMEENTVVDFTSVTLPKAIHAYATDPDGNAIAENVVFRWYNSANEPIYTGTSIPGVAGGAVLHLSAEPQGKLAKQYLPAQSEAITVNTDTGEITLTLQKPVSVDVTGRFVDAENETPLAGVQVLFDQVFNGSTITTGVVSDAEGRFSASILDMAAIVSISKDNYAEQKLDISSFGESADLGDIALLPLTGPSIYLNVNYVSAVEDGEEAPLSIINDFSNVRFELYNITRDMPIAGFTQQGNKLLIMSDQAAAGDEIRISITSEDGSFAEGIAVVIMPAGLYATATVELIESGSFRAEFGYTKQNTNYAQVYNADGTLVSSISFASRLDSSGNLPDGTYNVVFIGHSNGLRNVPRLSDYAILGLAEETDYVCVPLDIEAGRISVLKVNGIPKLDEEKLLYTDGSRTTFATNQSNLIIGNYASLRASTAFKGEYVDRVENFRWIFEYSKDVLLYDGSVSSAGSFAVPSESDAGKLIVWPNSPADTVRFCLVPTLVGSHPVSAFVEFELDGQVIRQAVGSLTLQAKNNSFKVPETTGKTINSISGTALPKSTVRFYVDGVYNGQTTANAVGRWTGKFELHGKYNYCIHDVHITVETPFGVKTTSEAKTVRYIEGEIEASRVKMYNIAHPAGIATPTRYETIMDFENPSAYEMSYLYWPKYPQFTFVVEIDDVDPAVVDAVYLTVYTSYSENDRVVLLCEYSPEAGGWVSTMDFPSYSCVPVNFKASVYTVTSETKPDNGYLQEQLEKNKIMWESFGLDLESGKFEGTLPEDNWVELIDYTLTESGDLVSGSMEMYHYYDGDMRLHLEVDTSIWSKDRILEFAANNNDVLDLGNGMFVQTTDDTYTTTVNLLDRGTGQKATFKYTFEQRESSTYMVSRSATKEANVYIPRRNSQDVGSYVSAVGGLLTGLPGVGANAAGAATALADGYDPNDLLDYIEDGCGLTEEDKERLKNEVAGIDKSEENYRIAQGAVGVAGTGLAVAGLYTSETPVGVGLYFSGVICSAFGASLTYCKDRSINERHNRVAQEIEMRAQNELRARQSPNYTPDEHVGNCDNLPKEPAGNPDLKPIHDPSGYIYEGVPSNRVQGATAALYEKVEKYDIYGEPYIVEEIGDNDFIPQANPQVTGADGSYGWDVPEGMWQVRVTKDGYEEARSEWLTVLPPRFDVNLHLVSYDQPEIEQVLLDTNALEIHFSKYMRPDSLNTNYVQVLLNGNAVEGTIAAVNAELNPSTKSLYASVYRFTPAEPFAADQEYEIRISRSVSSYAGVTMNRAYSAVKAPEARVDSLTVGDIGFALGEQGKLVVTAQPAAAAAGKVVKIVSADSLFYTANANSVTLDENGQAVITVEGKVCGTDIIALQLDGSSITASAVISVNQPAEEIIVKIPMASVESGAVPYGTLVELSCATEGATIYYTLDGSCPCDEETRIKYTMPIAITSDCTLRVMGAKDNCTDSAVGKFSYVVIYDPTEAIDISARSKVLGVGGSMQLNANIQPVSASPKLNWTSSSTKIATVDENGIVTGKKAGKVTVTATATDGTGVFAVYKITVGKYVNEISISGADEIAFGKSATLKASVEPSSAKTKTVVWTCSDASLATVSTKGVVKAAKNLTEPARVVITATAKDGSGVMAQHEIWLRPAATSVALTADGKPAGKTAVIDMAAENSTLQLGAVTAPENASQAVTWKSSSTKVAKVSADGVVTPVKPGTVTITATAKDGSKRTTSIKITVKRLVKEITISGATELAFGKSATLKAAVTPSNAQNKAVWWTSSDVSLASIDSKGVVKAAKNLTEPVQVIITATAKDGSGVTAQHEIWLRPAATSIALMADGKPAGKNAVIDMAAENNTLQLGAVTAPENASQAVTWKSSSTKVAKVSADGVVTPVKPGTVTITATAKDGSKKTTSIKITVKRLVKEITISGATELAFGKSATLKATASPSNAQNKAVWWTSSNVSLASIDSKGVVKAAKNLTEPVQVIITATAKDGSGVTAQHEIWLRPAATTLTLTVNGEPAGKTAMIDMSAENNTFQLGAVIAPENASQAVTWKSSSTKIAKVSADGVVTPMKAGTVTITATAKDGSKKAASIKITVKK